MRKAIGFLAATAVGVSLMCASAYAATTYAVSTVSGKAGGTVDVPVTVTADTATDTVNGYVVTFTYDAAKVTPKVATTVDTAGQTVEATDATGAACYATAGEKFAGGVLVADTITDTANNTTTLAVAWAAADPVTLDQGVATTLATVSFDVKEGVTESVPLTVATGVVAANGTDAPQTVEVASGSITIDSGFIRGDADGNGTVTGADATLVSRYVAKLEDIAAENMKAADANNDGGVTGADATLISRYVAKLETITQ